MASDEAPRIHGQGFESNYVTIWYDINGMSRAWGASNDIHESQTRADLERDEYQAGRPSIEWRNRQTYRMDAERLAYELMPGQVVQYARDAR